MIWPKHVHVWSDLVSFVTMGHNCVQWHAANAFPLNSISSVMKLFICKEYRSHYMETTSSDRTQAHARSQRRRAQNAASARRSRERRKEATERTAAACARNEHTIGQLEDCIIKLISTAKAAGIRIACPPSSSTVENKKGRALRAREQEAPHILKYSDEKQAQLYASKQERGHLMDASQSTGILPESNHTDAQPGDSYKRTICPPVCARAFVHNVLIDRNKW